MCLQHPRIHALSQEVKTIPEVHTLSNWSENYSDNPYPVLEYKLRSLLNQSISQPSSQSINQSIGVYAQRMKVDQAQRACATKK